MTGKCERFEFNVAGVTYAGRQDRLARLGDGIHRCKLVHEMGNRYDKDAIAVVVDGSMIGYVGREINSLLLPILGQLSDLRCSISYSRRLGVRFAVVSLLLPESSKEEPA